MAAVVLASTVMVHLHSHSQACTWAHLAHERETENMFWWHVIVTWPETHNHVTSWLRPNQLVIGPVSSMLSDLDPGDVWYLINHQWLEGCKFSLTRQPAPILFKELCEMTIHRGRRIITMSTIRNLCNLSDPW